MNTINMYPKPGTTRVEPRPLDPDAAVQIDQKLTRGDFSGAVLVRQGGKDLLLQAYGMAHRGWGIRNLTTTRFRIASIGKLFTAVAALQLIDSGRLALDTPVLEQLEISGTTIPTGATVRHFLTMTSGMADWCDETSETFQEDWERFRRAHPLYLLRRDADYLPIFAHLAPKGPVGGQHRYNGAGFMLLGLLIEKITGLGYFDYVRRHIFSPAGMSSSDFLDLDDIAPGVAEGYFSPETERLPGHVWKKNLYATTAGPAADGGATSTLEDLAAFVDALRHGNLLSPRWVRAMTSPQVSEGPGGGSRRHYGFGCFILSDEAGETLRWGHTGEEEGVSCRLWHYPPQDVTVVVLGNQSRCAGPVAQTIQEWVLEA